MGKHPHILIITNSYPNSRKPYAGNYIEKHVKLYSDTGFQVTVLSPGDSRRGMLYGALKYLRLALRLARVSVSTRFDLVHAHWVLPSGLFGLMLSKLRSIPFVITSHGSFTDRFTTLPVPIQNLVRFVLQRADIVIVVSQEQRDKVKAIAHLGSEKVAVINMGVQLPQDLLSQEEARLILGLPVDCPVILFVGNLEHWKGVDILLKAAAVLIESGESFQLFIGGQGSEEHNIAALIDALHLGSVVSMIGPIKPEDVYKWYSAATVVVIPSRSESFGLVAIEAMACGTPVVAAAIGGLAETIRHAENGFLFPPGDDDALARQLRQLLDSRELRDSVVSAGYRTAASHDMRRIVSRIEDIYVQLINRHS